MRFEDLQLLELAVVDRKVLHRNPRRWRWETRIPDFFNLWIGVSGRGMLTLNGRSFALSPGRSILLFPGETVAGEDFEATGMKNIALHFRANPAGVAELGLERYRNRPASLRSLALAHEWARHLLTLPLEDEAEANSLATHLLLLFLREAEMGPEDPADRIIRAQIERIRDQPYGTVAVAALAAEAGLSLSHYRRRFARLTQSTPNDFFIAQRLETAGQLLRESSLTVDQISHTLGYSDAPFFSRQFKQKTGSTPTGFRRQARDPRTPGPLHRGARGADRPTRRVNRGNPAEGQAGP